jgi:hypothetical protein
LSFVELQTALRICAGFLLLISAGCQKRDDMVSGTIEVDEVHVGRFVIPSEVACRAVGLCEGWEESLTVFLGRLCGRVMTKSE